MEKNQIILTPGHTACAGCSAISALRFILETLKKKLGKRAIVVVPAGCSTVFLSANFCSCLPETSMVHVPFETAATVAAAISDVLDPEDAEDTIVIAWAGDGGTYDIGIQALSSVAEQNRNILYICNNNGAYMNTGVQRSSATPWGAKTATTPGGSILWKKNMPEIMAAHRIPYVGVGSFGWKNRLEAMIIKAGQIYGCRYMDLNFPCPTGAKFPPDSAALIARLEAETGLFPLYEIVNGEIVIETMWPRPDAKLRPAEECLKLQGRFSHLQPGDIRVIQIQKRVIEERIALIKRAGLEPPDFSYLLNKED